MTLSFLTIMMQTSCVSMFVRTKIQHPCKETHLATSISLKYAVGAPFAAVYTGRPELLLLTPICLIDLPFSFVLDTLFFPTDAMFGPGALIRLNNWEKATRVKILVVDLENLPIEGARVNFDGRWFSTNSDGILNTKYKNNDRSFFVHKKGYLSYYNEMQNVVENIEDGGALGLAFDF